MQEVTPRATHHRDQRSSKGGEVRLSRPVATKTTTQSADGRPKGVNLTVQARLLVQAGPMAAKVERGIFLHRRFSSRKTLCLAVTVIVNKLVLMGRFGLPQRGRWG